MDHSAQKRRISIRLMLELVGAIWKRLDNRRRRVRQCVRSREIGVEPIQQHSGTTEDPQAGCLLKEMHATGFHQNPMAYGLRVRIHSRPWSQRWRRVLPARYGMQQG